jgi:hypothetical protein
MAACEKKPGISERARCATAGGNHSRQWARAPTCGNRSACGVGDSLVCLEARLRREEPQACNGSLCEHYRGEFACHRSGSSWLTEKNLPSNIESAFSLFTQDD